jgi:hypothetical protein
MQPFWRKPVITDETNTCKNDEAPVYTWIFNNSYVAVPDAGLGAGDLEFFQ